MLQQSETIETAEDWVPGTSPGMTARILVDLTGAMDNDEFFRKLTGHPTASHAVRRSDVSDPLTLAA